MERERERDNDLYDRDANFSRRLGVFAIFHHPLEDMSHQFHQCPRIQEIRIYGEKSIAGTNVSGQNRGRNKTCTPLALVQLSRTYLREDRICTQILRGVIRIPR